MAARYRFRHETVEARQFTPDTANEVRRWLATKHVTATVYVGHLLVAADGGHFFANSDDWLVWHGGRKFHRHSPQEFDLFFEEVTEDAHVVLA